VDDERIGRDTLHEKYIGPDGRVLADDCFAAEDGGVGIDRHVVSYFRMALDSFDDITLIVLAKLRAPTPTTSS